MFDNENSDDLYLSKDEEKVLSVVKENTEKEYDLDNRLIDFSVLIIDVVEKMPKSRAGTHIAGQLVRSGTSPSPNYAEAEGAESRKDFIHKMSVCLKELRESYIWLRIIRKKRILEDGCLHSAITECEELMRIFNASISTAKRKLS